MNNQQQVDKKRHSSEMMQIKSLNVIATSLISFFSQSSETTIKAKEKERESGRRKDRKERERVRRKRKEWKIFFFGNSYRN
jgi:hypothetical protein